MRVIAKKTLRDFWEIYTDSEDALTSWYQEASKSKWETPNDIKKEYPDASVLKGSRIVFNIRRNSYRLIVKINYEYEMVWIRFIGTHAQYDLIDAEKI